MISLNILLGFVSLTFLIATANKTLKVEAIEIKTVYYLIGLTLALFSAMAWVNKLYGEYLSGISLQEIDMTYFSLFSWTYVFDAVVPVLGLVYYLWKIKNNNLTSNV